MSCFSCGKGFNSDINVLLRKYKDEYDKLGIIRYFYKTETNGDVFVCRESSFNFIYEKHIKPNFQKGAEYSHISEFA